MGKFKSKTKENNKKVKSNKCKTKSNEYGPTKLNREKEGRHVVVDKSYVEGNSIITVSFDELERLFEENKDKVQTINDHKGTIKFDVIIGIFRSDDPKIQDQETNVGIVHYGKSGYHIVPGNPNNIKGE